MLTRPAIIPCFIGFYQIIPQQKDRLHICLIKNYNNDEIMLPDT